MKFTDSQKLACDISRNIAVTAGAGSGKTSVLVRRYLWCLEQNDYQVRRVVAITFTEKAAGEMLQRIRQTIFDYIEHKQGDPQRWESVLEQLPLANISTIHGFCQRLLREFPIEAEVDPNFEVFDEAARHLLLNRLLDELIEERAASDDADMQLLARFWPPQRFHEILQDLLNFREKSHLWSEGILKSNFPAYLTALYELKTQLQERKLEQLQRNMEWQECIERIPGLIPPGDTSKLSSRCQTVLELNAEFRKENDLEQQRLILGMLRKNLSLIGVNKAWKEENRKEALGEIFATLKTLYARSVPEYELNDALEQSSFHAQQALARLFEDANARYAQEKRARRMLDFDDLQESALKLTQHSEVQPILARRFDYLMVDEFQDTNHLQWKIIKSFGQSGNTLNKDSFCVVGDEKQSIYKFRGAEVAVFSEVRKTLKETNTTHHSEQTPLSIPDLGDRPEQREEQKGGELIMAENFRSSKELIFFFNHLFSNIFEQENDPERPFDVVHQQMRSLRDATRAASAVEHTETLHGRTIRHPVEFLLASKENARDTDEGVGEAELIARRILDFMNETVPSDDENEVSSRWKFGDIAILLRTRTRLKEFEEALRRDEIPFVVTGGIGFYEQQEIYDLANLLRFLADQRQDIALAGVLRSPLFSFSDDQLFYVSAGILSDETQQRWNLWERLRHHAGTPDLIPEELDASKFNHAFQQLSRWKALTDRIPVTHLLRRILDESGLYGILRGCEQAEQSRNNIEKLLDIARKFESEGFQALTDFVRYFDELIAIEEREGEAQLSTEGMNVVQLMTIHAAKGLEFPIVFIPELERPFNYGETESISIDALPETYQHPDLPSVAAGFKGINPTNNYAIESSFLRDYLKELNREKTDAEMKRLLYVACTRAEDCLILSASLTKKKDGKYSISDASWLAWLDNIFALQKLLAQENSSIILSSSVSNDSIAPLEIPLCISSDSRSSLHVERHAGRSVSLSTQSVEGMRDNAERIHEKKERSPFPERNPGGIFSSPELLAQMERNLRPLKGPENELFHVSPSTLHLLYQCPRKYYYHEILGLKGRLLQQIVPPSEEQGSPPTYGAQRGTLIHKLFEKQMFEKGRQKGIQLNELLKAEGIPRTTEMRQRVQRAIDLAGQHYVSCGIQKLLADSPEQHRELPFQLKIGQALISGVIDVLYRDPVNNVWTVLDYKSNEVEESQIEVEIEKHGYDLQMQIYALAVSRLMQIEQIHSILFFTFPGSRYETAPLNPEKLQAVEKSLAKHLRNISQNRIEPADKRRECDECEFRRNGICS